MSRLKTAVIGALFAGALLLALALPVSAGPDTPWPWIVKPSVVQAK